MAGGCKWHLYRGIHPRKKIAFTPKVPLSSHKSTLYTVSLLSHMQTSQQWDRSVVVMHSTEWFDCFY